MKGMKRYNDASSTAYTAVEDTFDVPSGSTFKIDGTALTASANEINMMADNSANISVAGAVSTLLSSASGTTYSFSSATEFALTLPVAAAGLRFKFYVGAAPASASYTIVTAAGANVIQGQATVNGAAVAAVNEDTITFTDGAAAVGDWVELICLDGTNWYVSGQGVAATAIVFTAT